MEIDWKEAANKIKNFIKLASDPIAVKLFESTRDLFKHPTVRAIVRKTNICQLLALSRYYRDLGIVYTTYENIACVFGAASVGLIKTPERLASGEIYMRYVSSKRAGRKLQENMVMIGNFGKKYNAIMCAPLDLTPIDPQVIVLYVTPAQALRLIISTVYHEGEPINVSITGQASVCTGIAKVILNGKPILDIPCIGDRMWGLVQEHELIFALPGHLINRLIEGLERTEGIAPYPFKPFLTWSVEMPPSYEVGRQKNF